MKTDFEKLPTNTDVPELGTTGTGIVTNDDDFTDTSMGTANVTGKVLDHFSTFLSIQGP